MASTNNDADVARIDRVSRDPVEENGEKVIYTPWITLRNGRVLRASEVGKKAFRLVIG